MREVNRSALILAPKQPFLDWLRSVDPTSSDLRLNDLRQEPTVYLIGECQSVNEFTDRVREAAPVLFEAELDGWWRDQAVWPTNRNFEVFERWFDYEMHSLVLDLGEDSIETF